MSDGFQQGLSVVVPVFNERDAIESTVEHLQAIFRNEAFEVQLIFVNDGSTDGTEEVLSNLESSDVQVVHHSRNRGYGRAIKSGMQVSVHEYIAITDADETYPNERLPEFFKLAVSEGLDMVVGARTGASVHIPFVRRPAKWVLRKTANYLTQTKIPDLNSGLRVMRKSVVYRFLRLLPDGFSLTTTITLAMLTNGYAVRYVPSNYMARKGKSKISPIRDTIGFFNLMLRTTLYFDPLRVFLPLSSVSFAIAVVAYAIRVVRCGGFSVTIVVLFLMGVQFLTIGALADLIVKRTDGPMAGGRERGADGADDAVR